MGKNILMLTNEYPPHVYGGAGVHVDHLVRELARIDNGRHRVHVRCFGDQQIKDIGGTVAGIGPLPSLESGGLRHPKLLDALYRNVVMVGSVERADLVHCHTWYTFLAGCLIRQLLRIPRVVTTHSLEPMRPWKQEQLGSGYHVTRWLEKTALENAGGVIAVSRAMRDDILRIYGVAPEKVRVIYNGIDTETYRPTKNRAVVEAYGIDSEQPFVLFVGRETRQKGIVHLIRALEHLQSDVQLVLCTGAADTPELSEEVNAALEAAGDRAGARVIRIREMVPAERLIVLYSHAAAFVCPSVYEPFGIINLEAMACGTPVIASAVGGIPEAVAHGQTGLLVPFEPTAPDNPEPINPEAFSRDLAAAIDSLLGSPQRCAEMAEAARQRVESLFSWNRIARRTLEAYDLLKL
jgi:glycogen synthase